MVCKAGLVAGNDLGLPRFQLGAGFHGLFSQQRNGGGAVLDDIEHGNVVLGLACLVPLILVGVALQSALDALCIGAANVHLGRVGRPDNVELGVLVGLAIRAHRGGHPPPCLHVRLGLGL